MIPSIQKKITALVISLAIQVISLTGIAGAATFPSPLTTLTPVTDQVSAPTRIAVDATTGYFYVTDPRSGGVQVYSKYGVYVKTLLTAATPKGIAFSGGNGSGAGKIAVTEGTFVQVIDVTNNAETLRFGAGTFGNADGIAYDSIGRYYWVIDTSKMTLAAFDSTTGVQASQTYPSVGAVPTDLKYVSVGGVGRLFLVDFMGQSLSTAAKSVVLTGTSLALEKTFDFTNFTAPNGIAVETSADGLTIQRVYIADAYQGQVKVFDYASPPVLLGTIGSYGPANGQLMVPAGLELSVVGTNKILAVANGYGNVTAYGIDGGSWPALGSLPVIGIVAPGPIATPSFTLNGTVTSATPATCSVHLNEANLTFSAPVVGSTWSANISGYGFGVNNFSVTCRNDSGSSTNSSSFTYNDTNGVTLDPVPQYTNKSNLLVTGTNAVGASVGVTNNGVSQTVSQGDATHWSSLVAIVPGANNIVATATKPNAPSVPATATVTYDNVPPTLNVSTLTSGDATSGQVLNVSGSASDDTNTAVTVAVVVNGATATPATLFNVTNGGGTFNVPVVLANGTNEIDIMATDIAGNTTVTTRVVAFDFDRTRPVLTVNQSDVVDTDVATLTVSGSVTNAVSVTVAGSPVTIDGSNNWTTGTPVTLVPGVNTIEIVATSLTGKTSSVKRTVNYNSTKPALALTNPLQDFATNQPSKDIFGTVGAAAAGVKCYFNGTTITPVVTAGAFGFNVPFPYEGTWDLYCTAVDGSNNVLSALTRTLVYDRTAPALTVDSNASAAPVTVTGTVDAGGKVNVFAYDGTNKLGATTLNNAAGTYSVDLTNVTYNPVSLLICGDDVAANRTCKPLVPIAKDMDYNGDGVSTTIDCLLMLRDVVNNVTPTPYQLAHADCGPLRLGACNPNGSIDLSDVTICMRVVNGDHSIPGTTPQN